MSARLYLMPGSSPLMTTRLVFANKGDPVPAGTMLPLEWLRWMTT